MAELLIGNGMKKVLIGVMVAALSFVSVGYAKPMTKKKVAWLETQQGVKEIGCNEYDDSSYASTGKELFSIKKSAFKHDKLFENSKLVCDLWDDHNKPYLHVIEKTKIDGIDIRFFHFDGSGLIGDQRIEKYNDGWRTGCKKDTMTDEVICYVSQNDVSLFRDKDGYLIRVGNNHYPSSIANLRINEDSPFSSGDDGIFDRESSEQIVSKLSPDDAVSTRYIEWPHKRNIDNTVIMDNYNVAKKVLDTLYENHN